MTRISGTQVTKNLTGQDISFGEGDSQIKGRIEVYIDVKYKTRFGDTRTGGIEFEFIATKGKVNNVHWLQFGYRYATGDKAAPEPYSTNINYDEKTKKYAGKLYLKYGIKEMFLDSKRTVMKKEGPGKGVNPAYYDSSAVFKRSDTESSIFDRPTMETVKGATESGFSGETYLVIDDKPVYRIVWARRRVDGKDSYVITEGKPVTGLSDTWKNKNLIFMGYEDEEMKKPVYVKSPIPAKNR